MKTRDNVLRDPRQRLFNNFEKVQYWAKFDLLSPPAGGQEFFFENWKTSLFYNYAVLTLCKISKTSGAQILIGYF